MRRFEAIYRDVSHIWYFPGLRIVFQALAGFGEAGGGRDKRIGRCLGRALLSRGKNFMGFQQAAGAAYRALTARQAGPPLAASPVPLLLAPLGADPHLSKFYKAARGNPALRPLLRRTGLWELREESRLAALRDALTRARDDAAPDWAAIAAP